MLTGNARTMSFSPDDKLMATVAAPYDINKVRIWDVAAGKEMLTIKVPDAKDVKSVAFSPDGRTLFTLDLNENRESWYCLRHWDVASGTQDRQWFLPRQDYPKQYFFQLNKLISLAPDGRTVFAALNNNAISIYDVETGRNRLLRGQDQERVLSLKLSPDARILAAGLDEPRSGVRLWEIASGKEIFLFNGPKGPVSAIAWSPNGRFLASGEGRVEYSEPGATQTVRLWDTATAKELAKFVGFNADVTSLTFSPDGKCLVAGLRDSTILIWQVDQTAAKLVPASNLGKKELESCWTDLAGDNAGYAHQAIWMLVIAPRQSVAFLQSRLQPIVPADASKIQEWIAALDSDKFAVRQAAVKELEKIGGQVSPVIEKALKGNISLEARGRLGQVLKNLSVISGSDTVRTVRAIMALERIGSLEAQGVLEVLARGAPGARETDEAKATLERLTRRKGHIRIEGRKQFIDCIRHEAGQVFVCRSGL